MKTQLIPTDFIAAVNDIKLAILQARARAAQVSNVEALKLYFFVGGYISKKTRSAKWGTGAIHALSERLQVELPGLRGFSSSGIKRMRSFYEAWSPHLIIRPTALGEIRHLASDEFGARDESGSHIEIRPTALGEFSDVTKAAFLKIGFSFHTSILEHTQDLEARLYYVLACARQSWSHCELVSHLRADDYHHVGSLPNNFAKTLPMVQATKAVRSFRDEYLLELINLDNVDAVHDQDVDERVLSKGLVANIEKTIAALGGNDCGT